ncbi:ribulose-phosphate 3-epimerase [Candidatus Wolfebacteria bacterium]|nr:ribulose-phosphate 3-epimerase [Candidatus Wolfebacteria bacterium]
MAIIPTINCENFECVKEKISQAAKFSQWVQIDIADGKFTKHKTWNNPNEFSIFNFQFSIPNLEIHLMTINPLKQINTWAKAGAKRIIIHIEALKDYKIDKLKNCEIGLVINPETPIEKIIPFLENNKIKLIQTLAVNPGKSGQKFQKKTLDKIKFLKRKYPNIKIEVDGGINQKTAKLCQKAGADILAVGSYIWKSNNPQQSYEKISKSFS